MFHGGLWLFSGAIFVSLRTFAAEIDSQECVIKENGAKYVLKGLASTVYLENFQGNSQKFYFSVCQPLGKSNNIPQDCDLSGNGCLTSFASGTETVTAANTGSSLDAEVVVTNGELHLKYTNGTTCGSGNFSTEYVLRCKHDSWEQGSSNAILAKGTTCSVLVIWETAAACPVIGVTNEAESSSPCAVSSPVGDETFSLKELNFLSEKSENPGSDYALSFCQPLDPSWSCGNYSNFCAKTESGAAVEGGRILRVALDRPRFEAKTGLVLHLDLLMLNGKEKSVDVRLECAAAQTFGLVNGSLVLEHPVVCLWAGKLSDSNDRCRLRTKNGKEVDLRAMFESPLAIQLNASQALNINLCKPFKPHSNSDICRNADSSAYVYGCLTQETSKKNMSLGRYWKAEQVSPSQTIVKVFEGSRCPSDKSKKISAVLTLICVAEHKGEAPVVNSTACDYQITWKTRFACPLKRVTGNDCKVTDDLHGWTFDFANLSRGGKYLASGGSGDVFVSLCKPLTKPEECRGSGVCAKLDKSQNSGFQKLGNASSAIVFEEGSLSLKYTGGEPTKDCPRGTQSLIIFACEEDSTTSSETTSSASPEVLMFASCTMHLLWRTKLACPGGGHGFEVSPVCKSTTTNIVDFTKLAMNGRNYEIPAGKSQTILLDVCAKLARGGRSGSGCSYDSGACLVVEDDKSGMRRYVSLGRQDADNVQLKTFPKNQSNILTYKHGDVCEVAGSAVAYHELSMLFLCDPKIPVGKPVLVKHPNNDPCMWRILWRTSAACPVLQPIDVNLDDGGDKYIPDNIPGLPKEESKVVARGYDCRLKDPVSGQKYDLNPLPKQVKVEAEDYKFNLSICNTAFAEMGSATCWSGVGCCVKSSKTGPYVNGGWFTPMLELRSDHSLELNYVGGDKCPKMASRRLATRIKFICAESKKESKARPTFLGLSSDCKFEFEWKTSHACPFGKNNSLESAFVNAIERGKCMVRTNDSVVDFSPLMSSLSNYKFIASSAAVHGHAPHDRNPWEYFLAVCRSLVPVPGLDCDPAAAACRGHATASNYTDVQVLGKFQTGPWVDVDGQVHLTYTDGSKCPTSAKDGKFSTDVAFKCGPGLGMPEFVGVTPECRVQLEWRSLTACPPPAPKPATKDCTYIDEERGLKFKLGTLRKDGYGYFVSERIGYNYITYMLNVCDHCGGCSEKNSAVCLQSMGKAVSFGRADKGFFLYRDGMLKLRYEGGDECEVGEGDRATEIWFECDPTADDQNAKPELYESYGCLVILKWKTTLVCLDGPNPNLHSRKGRGGTTGIFLSLVALVGLIIVVAWFVKHGKAKRRSTASIITRPSSSASDSGIRLRTRPRSRMDGFHSLFGSLRGRLLGFGSSGSRDTYSYRIVEGNDAELDRRDSGDSSDDALCRLTAVSPGTNYQLIASDRALVPLQEDCGPDLLVLDSEGNEPQMRRKPDLVSNQASPTFVVAEDDSDDDDELLQF